MHKLFEGDTIFDFLSLKKLADSYLENGSDRIELAGFQRGAAWKAWHVEALWDSILRWFPIGSLLLAKSTEYSEVGIREPQISKAGEPQNLIEDVATDNIYLLIDGQQRSNAIGLGFLPYDHPRFEEAGARLWIDLDSPINPSDKKFDFYLCTREDPFGENLTFAQKRNALDSIDQHGKDDSEINLFESYPAKAKFPVPFAEFVQILEDYTNWIDIREKLFSSSVLHIAPKTHEQIVRKLIIDPSWRIRDEIYESVRRVILEEHYKIPAVLFHKSENRVNSKELGKLFERINVNGVVPPQAELFYSALKLMRPKIGDYVAEVNRKTELKGILGSSQIIFTAIRMIAPDAPEISIGNFEKITNDYVVELESLLETGKDKESLFAQLMQKTYKALHYQGKGDYGIPRQLILRLRPRVWQTILRWMYLNKAGVSAELSESDRINIARFAILDAMDYFIFTKWWPGYSRYISNPIFTKLLVNSVNNQTGFSARVIFDAIRNRVTQDRRDNGQVIHVLTPDAYRTWISPTSENKTTWNSYHAGDVLLMYSQREYLHQWELLNDIDKDHIIPNSWMDFSGPTPTRKFWQVDSINADDGRSPIINSPGNFRFWPASLNRQYQDLTPSKKHINVNTDHQLDDSHVIRGLFTVGNVLEASSVNGDVVAMINQLETLKSNKDSRIWTTEQYKLLTDLVYERCVQMYQYLYDTLGLGEIS